MTRVFVGMSGGVDSSVAAALLVEQGYDVTGVYMKNWSQDLPGMVCPWADDLADAKRVAVSLGIDFEVFDFEREYSERVVQYMIDEYSLGRTPNPDIMCNQEVKFKLFLEASLERGADMIATGHYARVRHGSTAHSPTSSQLLQAVDDNKDQTYFLYRVTSQALSRTLFPLGDFTKSEVREMAAKRKLFTASKKESMGVCFVGQVDMREFLSQYIDTRPGEVIDRQSGERVGRHDGAVLYTLGQRHGLELGGGLPYYVVGKDMDANIVYVSRDLNSAAMWRTQIELTDAHWIGPTPPDGEYSVRVRHRAPLVACTLTGSSVTLHEAQRAITTGQSGVIYSATSRGIDGSRVGFDDGICLGGGIVA